MPALRLTPENTLPADGLGGTFLARVWVPVEGPTPALVTSDGVFSLFSVAPTLAQFLAREDPVKNAQEHAGPRIGSLSEVLENTACDRRDPGRPWFLAPADLHALKACGVTFAKSMLERVVENLAAGDPDAAAGLRATLETEAGHQLSHVRPGSPEAARVKAALVARGLWSPFMEVGIGPDAEIFTKAQPMAAVGTGEEVGVLPSSVWNNPEPEVVLAVSPAGRIVGATLGNDVNIRDLVGRSILLASRAKDNRASCALGPFLRLVDATFALDDIRRLVLDLQIEGDDGFTLSALHDMAEISRDVTDLVGQVIGQHNQYPDGLLLFTGTSVAPAIDRDRPGRGFAHHVGDVVTIRTPKLGALINRVNHTDRISPWTFGTGQLLEALRKRQTVSMGPPA